jgi:ABC-type glycerol-3-phosphate transport system substrate-binding protein
VLFTIGSTSSLPYYRSSVAEGAGFNWSIAPLPTSLEAPKMHVHGPSLVIFEATPEKQLAAWLFSRWFTAPEQQARWTRATNTLPIRESTADLLQDVFAENPQYEKAFGFLGYDATIEPGVTGYGECRQAITEMMTAAADLENPETWLAVAVEACNISLEEIVQ